MARSDPRITKLTAAVARDRLYSLIDRAVESGEPIRVSSAHNSVVLLSERDWSSIQETLHLLSMPGMRESIRRGLKTPVGRCAPRAGL